MSQVAASVLSRLHTSNPSMTGIVTSRRIRSGANRTTPSWAPSHRWPPLSSIVRFQSLAQRPHRKRLRPLPSDGGPTAGTE